MKIKEEEDRGKKGSDFESKEQKWSNILRLIIRCSSFQATTQESSRKQMQIEVSFVISSHFMFPPAETLQKLFWKCTHKLISNFI